MLMGYRCRSLLPEPFFYDLFMRHNFFDVIDATLEDERHSRRQEQLMALHGTLEVRDDETETDSTEPRA